MPIAVALALNTSSAWLPGIFAPATTKLLSASLLPSQSSEDLLRGRWVRPDGGYVIEIREAQAGGGPDAAYLNPRPINVSRA
jgi:hypothetical protein